ncbi:hypothetical protein AGR1C_Lc80261 [Agrobacterium fabacearum TT111]|nr:hypothetical protein AGR1C_Lc80261 [Agrobacterium fabacearum TT111]
MLPADIGRKAAHLLSRYLDNVLIREHERFMLSVSAGQSTINRKQRFTGVYQSTTTANQAQASAAVLLVHWSWWSPYCRSQVLPVGEVVC